VKLIGSARAILLLMTRQRPSVPLDRDGPRPSQVEIVVLVRDDGGQRHGRRIRGFAAVRQRALTASLVLVAAAIGASTLAVVVSEVGHGRGSVGARGRDAGPAGVADAYGHGLRCLTVTIAPNDPAYARADFNRAVSCGRYAGYATAIFHRVRGVWRPVLDSLHYSCPAPRVPSAIQAELGVCP
jgi:hypothetical protein